MKLTRFRNHFKHLAISAFLSLNWALPAYTSPFRTIVKGEPEKLLTAQPGDTVRISFAARNGGVHSFILERVPDLSARQLRDGELLQSSEQTKPILFRGRRRLRANDRVRASGWVPVGVAVDAIDERVRIRFHTRGGRFASMVVTSPAARLQDGWKGRLRYFSVNKELGCKSALAAGEQSAPALETYCEDRGAIQPGSGVCKGGYVNAPQKILTVSTDADAAWYQIYGANTNAQIQAILNAAQAIYLRDLGITFELDTQNYFTTETVYTSSAYATLLNQFTNYGNSQNHLGDAVVKHLFTGKNVSAGVIGYAWLDVLCNDPDYSYGFSQVVNENIQALVTAHEFGHNMGAYHTDPGGGNANTIMAPAVSAQNTYFSNCSLCEIKTHNERYGSCLKTGFGITSARLKGRQTKRKVNFSARLSIPEESSGCSLTLYGGKRKKHLKNSISSKAKVIYQQVLSDQTSLMLSAKIRNGKADTKLNTWLRAVLNCGGDDELSNLKRIKGYLKAGKVIKRLQSAIVAD